MEICWFVKSMEPCWKGAGCRWNAQEQDTETEMLTGHSSRGLTTSPCRCSPISLHAAKLVPQAKKHGLWWFSNLCHREKATQVLKPLCTNLKTPKKNTIVLARVKFSQVGQVSMSSKGCGMWTPLNFHAKHILEIEANPKAVATARGSLVRQNTHVQNPLRTQLKSQRSLN